MTRMFRYANELDDEDDTENEDNTEILKDGESYRVPVFLRDSADHVLVDGFGQPLDARGGRRAGYVFTDASQGPQHAIDHALRKAQLSAAWRGGLRQGDQVVVEGERLEVLGYNDDDKVVLADASALDREAGLDADSVKKAAYDSAVAELSDRWRTRPPRDEDDDEEEEGEEKNKRKKRRDREFELAGPLSDSDIRAIDEAKREAWEDSVRDLQGAWRR